MQLSSEVHIPDGLLAANALLSEKSRLGLPTSTQALHPGFGFRISNTHIDFPFRCSGIVSGTVVAPNNEKSNCPPIPPAPNGVSLKANMAAAANAAFLPDPIGLLLFRNNVNYGGTQDYKVQGAQYENFGNFNYGATGTMMNIPAYTLDRAAGRAQRGHPSSPQFGGDPGNLPSIFFNPNGGTQPYGDDPNDQIYVNMGIQYAQMGCGG